MSISTPKKNLYNLSELLIVIFENKKIAFTVSQKDIRLFKDAQKKKFLACVTQEQRQMLLKAGCIREDNNFWHITQKTFDMMSSYKKNTLSLKSFSSNAENKEYCIIHTKESALLWLSQHTDKKGRKWLEEHHLEAAQRLYNDFIYAGIHPHITTNYATLNEAKDKKNKHHSGLHLLDNKLTAKNRLNKVLRKLDEDSVHLLLDICCYQYGLEQVEKSYGWPRRSAKLMLRTALSNLAHEYNLIPQNMQKSQSIQLWFMDKYQSKTSSSL